MPTDVLTAGLETFLDTVADHGLHASTLSARVPVSMESGLYSAATAAVGTLTGPLHGDPPGSILEMLRTGHETDDPEG